MSARRLIEGSDGADARLTEVFGRPVGLNADWGVTAWAVRPGPNGPNRGQGVYIIDDEPLNEYALVRRNFEDPDAEPEILLSVPEGDLERLIAAAQAQP